MIWLSILIGSSILLAGVILKNKLSYRWIKRFSLHLVVAAIALYLLNYSGVVQGFEVPINPTTIGTVVLLGIPGIILMLGLQQVLL